MVGLIPLFAVETLEPELLDRLPGFKRRLEWFIDNRPDLIGNVACMRTRGKGERRLLSIVGRDQLRRMLQFMLDESEFLSPYGIRALSHYHNDHPYTLAVNGMEHRVDYEPAESSTGLFGGNSNWRGPIWFPMNYLLVESLQKFHHYLGDDFKVEFPSHSGNMMTLSEVAAELSRRLSNIFLRDDKGERPVYRNVPKFQTDPTLERSGSVSRILPRRYRQGRGSQSSDRMDRARHQIAAAKRRVPQTQKTRTSGWNHVRGLRVSI